MNSPSPSTPRDLYQEATDRIIKALEAGTTPWQKPWENVSMGPLRNGTTGNAYHGINTVMLYCAGLERGFTDPRWVSFKQCQQNGWKIKKGAKSERVFFYKQLTVDERDHTTGQTVIDAATGKPRQKQLPFLQASPVFNAQEIEGMPPIGPGDVNFSPIEAGEAIAKRSPVEIRYGGNSAHYNRVADTIGMPAKDQFKSPETYYSALAHEMIHSTGHQSRCNREFGKRFGDSAYAFEEMIAEMGSLQLAMETGLPSKIENHASYIENWLAVLKGDKKAVFMAAAKSSQAVDFVMGRQSLDTKAQQTVEAQPSAKPVEKPATVIQPPATKPDSAAIPAALAVVAKLKARRAKQVIPAEPRKGPTMRP